MVCPIFFRFYFIFLFLGFWFGFRVNRLALRALAVIKYNFNLMSLQFVSVVCAKFFSPQAIHIN